SLASRAPSSTPARKWQWRSTKPRISRGSYASPRGSSSADSERAQIRPAENPSTAGRDVREIGVRFGRVGAGVGFDARKLEAGEVVGGVRAAAREDDRRPGGQLVTFLRGAGARDQRPEIVGEREVLEVRALAAGLQPPRERLGGVGRPSDAPFR